ncbi:MAG: type II toxin-antitoxin system Phd/YefM family antitoxin [Burkholderiaceae bacterium]|jgi:prevent-host-death family protein|nr:type II toxin-antitoxin system Phd/YefM family antitoxin [Burkholderiaceae bacterium]MEB2318832.1 type II toxin-antitoxin system Phd/YefM family antitoxin [Pseudomonadota bacterium]
MKTISIAEAKARFSALLAQVEGGEEIAVTRRGGVVARLVPDRPCITAEAFRDFWSAEDCDLEAPPDLPAEGVATLGD